MAEQVNNSDLRTAILAAMQARGMTRYALAQALHMPKCNLYRVFKPDYDPKLSTLEAVCAAVGVELGVRDGAHMDSPEPRKARRRNR